MLAHPALLEDVVGAATVLAAAAALTALVLLAHAGLGHPHGPPAGRH